jgi:hypothetical protein
MSYADKHAEYDAKRGVFYDELEERAREVLGIEIRASCFSYAPLATAMHWQGRRYDWDWFELARDFGRLHSRLELAIYAEGHLCGLMVGRPSRGRRHISAYFIEGNPADHPLKGRLIQLFMLGLDLYGAVLNCRFARLVDPVRALIPKYVENGFTVVLLKQGKICCEKALERSGT